MSYNEDDTRRYNEMLYNFEIFSKMKKSLLKQKCSIHNKRLKMMANWENEYFVDIFISGYCCKVFAEEIAKEFIDAHIFNGVNIEE